MLLANITCWELYQKYQTYFSQCPYSLAVMLGLLALLLLTWLWCACCGCKARRIEQQCCQPVCCQPNEDGYKDAFSRLTSMHAQTLERLANMQRELSSNLYQLNLNCINTVTKITETFVKPKQ